MKNIAIVTVVVFILVSFALITFSIFENPDSNNSADLSIEKEQIILKTVSMFGGTDSNVKTYQNFVESFSRKNPNVTVMDSSTASNEAWKSEIAMDFAVGNEPDVLFFFTDANASNVLSSNQFMTVEEIRAEFPNYGKDIKASALDSVRAGDGNIYALPLTGYYEGIFCNKDLFEQYGVELPTDWDKLIKAIEVFSASDIVPIAVSLSEVPHYWIEHLIFSAGGVEEHSLSPKNEIPESWIKGLEMFKTLRDMNAFPADTDLLKNNDIQNMFINKKAAMQLDGSWFAKGIRFTESTTVLPFPVMPGGKKQPSDIITGFSSGFYITKEAWNDPARRKAAVDFVMEHTSVEAISEYWKGSSIPAADCESPENMPALFIDAMNMISSAENTDSAIDSRLNPEAFKTLVGSISDISEGRVSAEDILAEVIMKNN